MAGRPSEGRFPGPSPLARAPKTFKAARSNPGAGCIAMVQAYCVKCRAKREMKDAKKIKMKNGKPAMKGVCPKCGTKMFRIGE